MKPSEYIKKHGWCKNIMEDNQGRVCLLGAIREVNKYKGSNEINDMKAIIQEEIKRRTNNRFEYLDDYNDAPSRRKKDIIKLLEKLGL